jgi:tRNA modification GTPase
MLTFEAGASFTGEQAAELQVHGSPATVSAILRALGAMSGLRMAEAGEFARRALENGNLDLAEVEGLADLLEAETEAQRKQALRVLSGAVGKRAEEWRRLLVRAGALIEATIDFADEDVPIDVTPEVIDIVEKVSLSLRAEIRGYHMAERIRDGFEVAIVGEPNAGKSTLLNILAGRDAAITSEHAGTTRDVIEVRMDLSGLPVTILDTAGLRETLDPVESIGIARALDRARQADLRVFLLSNQEVPLLTPEADDLVVWGKADQRQTEGVSVSGKTGEGVDRLINDISRILSARAAGAGSMIRERHRKALIDADQALESARNHLCESGDAEIAAEWLRRALRSLDSLIGRVDVEDFLSEIFSSFCIGK